VECQQASGRTPGAGRVLLQYPLLFPCIPSRAAVVAGWWNGGSRVVGVRSMAHCWVLRQQAPRCLCRIRDGSLLPLAPCGVAAVGCRGGARVGGVVAGSRRPAGRIGRCDRLRPVCGVCGLLFENCIVDASILRTGAAADPVTGPPSGGPVCWWWCGAVFVIDRRRWVVPASGVCCWSFGAGGVCRGGWCLLVGVFCDHVASF